MEYDITKHLVLKFISEYIEEANIGKTLDTYKNIDKGKIAI